MLGGLALLGVVVPWLTAQASPAAGWRSPELVHPALGQGPLSGGGRHRHLGAVDRGHAGCPLSRAIRNQPARSVAEGAGWQRNRQGHAAQLDAGDRCCRPGRCSWWSMTSSPGICPIWRWRTLRPGGLVRCSRPCSAFWWRRPAAIWPVWWASSASPIRHRHHRHLLMGVALLALYALVPAYASAVAGADGHCAGAVHGFGRSGHGCDLQRQPAGSQDRLSGGGHALASADRAHHRLSGGCAGHTARAGSALQRLRFCWQHAAPAWT